MLEGKNIEAIRKMKSAKCPAEVSLSGDALRVEEIRIGSFTAFPLAR
jgi:hypothetical protein